MERQIEFGYDALENVNMNAAIFWKFGAYVGDLPLLLVVSSAMHLALFKRTIIKMAAKVERGLQRYRLFARRNQSVFVRFNHINRSLDPMPEGRGLRSQLLIGSIRPVF